MTKPKGRKKLGGSPPTDLSTDSHSARTVPIEKLEANQRNPRTHSREQIVDIASSILEFGFVAPIVVDENGVILAGHGRYQAAQKLGLATVPVVLVSDLSAPQKRAYSIADNRLAESAAWDAELLSDELRALASEDDFDLSTLGFSDRELAALLEDEPDPKAKPPATELPDPDTLRVKWKTELGQLWTIGAHRLLCGDATAAEDVERVLAGEPPFLMVTDPPYGVGYDPDWRNAAAAKGKIKGGSQRTAAVPNDDRRDWRQAYELFSGDVAYVWYDALSGFEVGGQIQAAGFELRAQIVWTKSSPAIGRGHYSWQHETCYYAVRKGRGARWVGSLSESTLWTIPVHVDAGVTRHSTQKRLECMSRPIRNHGAAGDIVFDPFVGSGTTIFAAEQLGRRCYAIEIDPAFVAVTLERLKQAGLAPELASDEMGKKR